MQGESSSLAKWPFEWKGVRRRSGMGRHLCRRGGEADCWPGPTFGPMRWKMFEPYLQLHRAIGCECL